MREEAIVEGVRDLRLVAGDDPALVEDLLLLLAEEPLILYERGGTIRQVIEGWFKRARVTPRVAMELGNSEAIKELVSAGLGPSITSWASVRAEAREGELRVIPLSPPLVRRLGIIKRRDKPENPALAALLRALERRAGRRVS